MQIYCIGYLDFFLRKKYNFIVHLQTFMKLFLLNPKFHATEKDIKFKLNRNGKKYIFFEDYVIFHTKLFLLIKGFNKIC